MHKRTSWFLVFFWFWTALGLSSCATPQDVAERKRQSEALRTLGERLMADEKFTPALRELQKAEDLYADDHILQNDLGLVYLQKGKLDLALTHLKKAVALKPSRCGLAPVPPLLNSSTSARWPPSLGASLPVSGRALTCRFQSAPDPSAGTFPGSILCTAPSTASGTRWPST